MAEPIQENDGQLLIVTGLHPVVVKGKTDTKLSYQRTFFVVIRTDIPEIRMLPPAVIEHLDVSDDIVFGFLTRGVHHSATSIRALSSRKTARQRHCQDSPPFHSYCR